MSVKCLKVTETTALLVNYVNYIKKFYMIDLLRTSKTELTTFDDGLFAMREIRWERERERERERESERERERDKMRERERDVAILGLKLLQRLKISCL